MRLERVEGPECPRCGCRDTAGTASGLRLCLHCGKRFSKGAGSDPARPRSPDQKLRPGVEPAPQKLVARCKACGSDDVVVTHTVQSRRVRYRRCRRCGARWKTVIA